MVCNHERGLQVDRNEAHARALSYALHHVASDWCLEHIRALLETHGNDPRQALEAMDNFQSEHLGNFGMMVPGLIVEAMQPAKSGPIEVYYGDDRWERLGRSKPHFVITWLEVFEYVAGRPHQLSLLG
jgi:hypothetical protein